MCKMYRISVYRDHLNDLTYRTMMDCSPQGDMPAAIRVTKDVLRIQPAKVIQLKKKLIKKVA